MLIHIQIFSQNWPIKEMKTSPNVFGIVVIDHRCIKCWMYIMETNKQAAFQALPQTSMVSKHISWGKTHTWFVTCVPSSKL